MQSNKSYRIRINPNEEYVNVDLNLNQDIDMFEMLSLKIDSKNFYKLQTSNYGCVAGRVLANNAVGVPNVKLSIFIAADESTKSDSVLNSLYPFGNPNDKDENGVRYNLLTEEELTECYQTVGTFPSKRLVLDDKNVFEIFDKYYKFTTTTNTSGDYMLFGIPIGTQTLHMDVDLSDIGTLLSQTPRDFIYKGYDRNLFESPSQFKKDTNLGLLPQIISQNESVYVYPFWGDSSEMMENDSTGVRISRKDINLNYKFEPTCIFFGSLVSDEKSNGFSEKCVPTDRMGKMDRLTTGEGTIEMIRKTPDGLVESFNIGGTHLINGDGVWCYQIPMNLDFIRTDENGNIVPSDDPNNGLPTRTRVRFRFSLNDFASDYENNHLCKILVPNNTETRDDYQNTFAFGSYTNESDFRDLLWNKVYSVKSFVPRIQKSSSNREKRFSGIKAVNVNVGNNPIPYNNIRVDITLMFVFQCAIMHTLIWIVGIYNGLMCWLYHELHDKQALRDCYDVDLTSFTCISIGDGACPELEGWFFAPNCNKYEHIGETQPMTNIIDRIEEKRANIDGTSDEHSIDFFNTSNNDGDGVLCVTWKIDYFVQCVELALAQEYDVIQFDFYNDWLNGVLYMPRWFAKIKKKRSYLFGLIKTREKILGCMQDTFKYKRRYVQQCSLKYDVRSNNGGKTASSVKLKNEFGCTDKLHVIKLPLFGVLKQNLLQKCHKGLGRESLWGIFSSDRFSPGGGIVHSEKTIKEEYAYYFRPCDFYRSSATPYIPGVGPAPYDIRVIYFATDVILLGSIVDNDLDGVPIVTEMVSSSYKLPTPLAATNMGIAGIMYAAGGVYCGGSAFSDSSVTHTSVSEVSDTFSNYQNWASTTDFSNMAEEDANEYPVTESAGIDWGYVGPEVKDIYNATSDSKRQYYYPGGHFLGLSCFNSETNVKSCLNLSRVCEIGVNISRRKPVSKLYENQTDNFVIPNGLISKYDISDTDFRSLFATLNHNGLKTVRDEATGRFIYDFIPLTLTGFEGAMNSDYLIYGSRQYEEEGKERIIEDISTDTESFDEAYYNFRLGIGNTRDKDVSVYKKYLLHNEYYSIPMYNNSFYFYFGLHDGATALDKFYEDFYGKCATSDNSTDTDSTVNCVISKTREARCEKAYAAMFVTGLGNDFLYNIYYYDEYNGKWKEITNDISKHDNVITVTNLVAGDYYILLNGTYRFDFKIEDVTPFSLGLYVTAVDFTKNTERVLPLVKNSVPSNGGYIKIESYTDDDVISRFCNDIFVYSKEWTFDRSPTSEQLNKRVVYIEAKKPNTKYKVAVVCDCGDDHTWVYTKTFTIGLS